jgi:2-polyprenyl-3-methyl-5-hydroxy-6-metoxy-1,4-benzoquinol methylase
MNTEKDRLEKVAADSLYTTMSNAMMIQYCSEVFSRHLVAGSILEMGPAEGLMTNKLVKLTEDLTLLEGSANFCNQLSQKFPSTKIHNTLFEDFQPDRSFDNIILGHVLEHVEDPVNILSIAKNWLSPNGRILSAVPNSQSIHRQAAVIMELLETEESMSELDIHHGHRRIYNPFTFRNDFKKAGLQVKHYGGYWLKPVSNSQIHANWTEEMLWAFMKMGERYPDIAAEIYVVAEL